MICFFLSAAIAASPVDVWPAFRGTGSSVSAARGLPLTWNADDGVAWSIKLPGKGQSGPVVWRDRVFVTSVTGSSKKTAVVTCVELTTGRRLWQKEFKSSVPAKVSGYISQSAPTPAVDAKRVYAFFEVGNLVALDHAGKVVWQRSLTDDYGKFLGNHGLGNSIALTDDAVIILVDHAGPSYLLAVDKATGKTLWKADRPQKVSWSSPIVDRTGETTQIIVSSNGTCEAFEAKTGKQLWIVEGIDGNTVPSATVTKDLIVVGSGKVGSNLAIRRGGLGNVTKTHVAWRSQDATATFSSPLIFKGHVYLVNRAGVAFCLDQSTGSTMWKQRIGESCWASPLGAGKRVYFFGKSGRTTVVATGPKPSVLAENVLPTDDRVYGVAAVDNRFVIRSGNRLDCIARENNGKGKKIVSEKTSDKKADQRPFPDLPRAITSFGAAVLDDSIYVYGGNHGQPHHYSVKGQSGELWRLNLKKPSAWEVAAKGPKLQGLAMVAHKGKLYRAGGFTARNGDDEEQDLWSTPEFSRFDPKTKKWEGLPPMPTPRSSFDAAVAGDTLYVVGGWSMQGDQETVWHNTAFAVDLSQNQLRWKPLPKPPFQRRALSVGAVDGKLYVIGGIQPNGKITTRTAIFDPKADVWTEGPKLPGDDMEGFGSACFPVGGRLYVSTASGTILALSSDGKSWQEQDRLKAGRFFHRMLPIDREHLVFLGGASMKKGRFSKIELVKVRPLTSKREKQQ